MKANVVFLLLSLTFLGACGDGGGGSPTPTNDSKSLNAGGVKGPLADALVTIYAFDAAQPDFKGSVVDTATTDATAISRLTLPLPLTPPYIMEVTSTPGTTTDITTGQFPVITTLRTVITQQRLDSGEHIYATPLTTMATDLAIANANSTAAPYAGDNNGTTTAAEFLAALPTAASQVVSTVGFGLGVGVDIFAVPPLVDSSTDTLGELINVAAYRAAVEALTALIYEMSLNAGALSNDVLRELIADLADGNGINGSAGSLVDLLLLQQNPATLPIPNSPTNQTMTDVQAILADETGTTGSTTPTTALTDGTITTILTPAETNPDIDSDGIADNADNCPAVANADQADADSDGTGDLCDDPTTYYQDSDSDGYGDSSVTQLVVMQPVGYVLDNTDCDDSAAAVNPGATEVPDDGIDNNCDGQQAITYYQDSDSDGYGNLSVTQVATSQPAGYLLDNTDCDDSAAAINPGAIEVPDDGIDNNCDGLQSKTYYQDADSDGYGNPAITQVATSLPAGYLLNNTDCDDSAAAINPGAIEVPDDGIDNNCDGLQANTYYQDADSDGYGNPVTLLTATLHPVGYVLDNTDCDDSAIAINPGATEVPDDGIDNNCDGQQSATYYLDSDSDGYGTQTTSQIAISQPAGYVLDNTDCNDTTAAANPGATEIADGIDNDCDSEVDEGFNTYYQDADSDGYGNLAVTQLALTQPAGYVLDNTDCDDSSATVNPAATENPSDGIDNNCDGQIDEGFIVTYYQDADGDNYGDPATSQDAIAQPVDYVLNNTDCDDTSAAINPGATEIADGVDNDCDGQIDEDTTLTCTYETPWNAVAHEPAVFNSFTEFQTVVDDCGGLPIPDIFVVGKWHTDWYDGVDIVALTLVYDSDLTLTYTKERNGIQEAFSTGTWSIVNDQLITRTDDGSFAMVAAFTSSMSAPIKIYYEQSGWSSSPNLSTLDGVSEGAITEWGRFNQGPPGENSTGATEGTVTLSGSDTAFVGTQLDTGYIGTSLSNDGQPDTIVIVEQSGIVTFEEPNSLLPWNDPNNGFTIVVLDIDAIPLSAEKGISMAIMVNGIKHDYTCTTPFSGTWSVDCGGASSITLDIVNRTVSFNNTTVKNMDTDSLLTLNGTLTWIDDGGNPGVGPATELEGSWSSSCYFDPDEAVYIIPTFTFRADAFFLSEEDYSDADCTILEASSSVVWAGRSGPPH
ncbi:MAG: putative metal-binding motif-containing protein [gamma proteobacterium endosymbiont of Lamellibrachia anaximandri]|nr:putative metal-binding motif-containing protein [gamma proteobacterium endosymbiont of Lamellibrachia anaximandri]